SETRGIFATMFNYGDVHVQTAGSQKEFVIYDVHDPKLVRDQIMRAQEAAAREKQNVRIIQD
ncbi:MAG: hypothetical protein LRY44_02145, partial [Candidatus Pacebacteria bacterium]|nr:hypothetical protein [Candidatus Paceibacterota bacterium]